MEAQALDEDSAPQQMLEAGVHADLRRTHQEPAVHFRDADVEPEEDRPGGPFPAHPADGDRALEVIGELVLEIHPQLLGLQVSVEDPDPRGGQNRDEQEPVEPDAQEGPEPGPQGGMRGRELHGFGRRLPLLTPVAHCGGVTVR